MKDSPRVNIKVAVAKKDETNGFLTRVALIAFAVVGVVAILEVQVAIVLALGF